MALALKAEEQELLQEEVAAFAAATRDPERRQQLEALTAMIDSGTLPDDALEPIGHLLEIGLQTGRIRRVHRAVGEQALLRLFDKTPAGEARAAALAEVNQALAELAGQEVESVRVLSRTPGTYLLMISTNACELVLRFDPDGAQIESVAIGV